MYMKDNQEKIEDIQEEEEQDIVFYIIIYLFCLIVLF